MYFSKFSLLFIFDAFNNKMLMCYYYALLSFVGGDFLSLIIGGEFHYEAFYTSLIILNKQLLNM